MLNFLYNHSGIIPIDRVAFSIFGVDVYWYGVCIITGALIALFYGLKIGKKLGIKEDILLDGFIIGMIVGIIGARLYYVAFEWDMFKDNPISIFTDWRNGGLAIHGGIIAAAIFIVVYCKIRKVNPIKLAEIVAPGFLIGQMLGRFGNFFNQEATGGLVPGATLDAQREFLKGLLLPDFIVDQMYITRLSQEHPVIGYYHPTFLYESLWNLLGFILIVVWRKKSKSYWIGDGALIYLMWYSFGRFFIEGMRTDSLMIGGLRTAQLISIILFVAGAVLYALRRIYRVYPESFMEVANGEVKA